MKKLLLHRVIENMLNFYPKFIEDKVSGGEYSLRL